MLKIKNISKVYDDSNESICVFKDVCLNVYKGTIVSIMGKSGSGKTTLLNIIGGLLKPDAGHIYLNDSIYRYENYFSKFRSKSFGYIFQNHNLLPEFTVKENLLLPTLIADKNNGSIKKIDYYLELLNLSSYKNKYPVNMSKGECQRISIIRALMNEPKLIIADEPTANLDENNVKIILNLFIKLNKELNCTFIIATHDKKFIDLSNEIYYIDNFKLNLLENNE